MGSVTQSEFIDIMQELRMSGSFLARILVIADDNPSMSELSLAFTSVDFNFYCIPHYGMVIDAIEEQNPDLLIVDMDAFQAIAEGQAFARKLKKEYGMPLLVFLSTDILEDLDFTLGIDDFVVKPYEPVEVISRIKQILWRTSNIDDENLIKHGDLIIDLVSYEVSVAGRVIDLSFKEYELLKILVSNKQRVLTRQALLDKVWGYDYYGGDRTVDVHIRRLRSKIEDAEHSFIQTVRNVGYKFNELKFP